MLKRLCLVVLMIFVIQPLFSQEVQDTIKVSTVNTNSSSVVHGTASWYGGKHHGRKTASGKTFDQNGMTCASNIHKLGTKLKVTNPFNGNSVIVEVTDRGGFSKMGRLLDLSKGAFAQLAPITKGLLKVQVEIVG